MEEEERGTRRVKKWKKKKKKFFERKKEKVALGRIVDPRGLVFLCKNLVYKNIRLRLAQNLRTL